MKNKKGVTLIEIAVSTAILAIVASFSFPAYKSFEMTNKIASTKNTTITALLEARSMAQSQVYDSDWGVKITNSQATVFAGSSYLTRDISKDKNFDLPIGLAITGDNEIVFSKLTAIPVAIANFNITYAGKNSQISVNEKGVFNY